ncbi:MAG TPA: MBL fold metallo-hydrolase [Bryobacteraceae bacterium]|jgi:beta-lactamase superfamily II metal-dependent hydrolase|nr:MBL fold metallo-hydrolase [Bryobacteraceae bacterium]
MRAFLILLLAAAGAARLPAAKNLEIYFIDVEGGQATLFVAPSGQSMLIDTGWSGNNSRDADRIAAAAKHAGVKAIDYLLITHFHEDHVGGVPQLARKLPIHNFIDHGEDVEQDRRGKELYAAYVEYRAKGTHILAKPGITIPIKGLEVQVLTADGDEIATPLPGAGQPNPACANAKLQAPDPSENARSVGTLTTFGNFRILDMGDLTWNKEHELVCPNNKIGAVDLYIVSHHGSDLSGSPAFVDAIHPRVAIMDNGARKGGSPSVWQTIHSSPGLEDIWQLHYAISGGKDNNAADTYIANTDEVGDHGNWIEVTVHPDGSFLVNNTRNKFTKTYASK